MKREVQTGFKIPNDAIRNDIYIPRYYDPRIAGDLKSLRGFTLHPIRDLVAAGSIEHTHGDYVPKLHYGTGPYPYLRTSDIANWEVKASPKHGVARSVFDEYNAQQDVKPEDILFVHEGTYLIGSAAMVTKFDGPMLYQHHLAKFRVKSGASFSPYYLLAAFGSPIVQRQIRARQFSADIIDSVVGRLEEIVLPVPKDADAQRAITKTVKAAVNGRASLRERLSQFIAGLETALTKKDVLAQIQVASKWQPDPLAYSGASTFLGERKPSLSFKARSDQLKSDILIPKYYDPTIKTRLKAFGQQCELVSLEEMIRRGWVTLKTGDEIGRLAYGTGTNSFVRTSDLGAYELKADAKHGINSAVLSQFAKKQDLSPGDVLLVRDGTYLVGTSTIIFEEDMPLLFCGGIYKIGFPKPDHLPPGLGYALLNMPVVRRQMRNKQFTRDVIDTLGHRIREVVFPVPKDLKVREAISDFVYSSCQERVRLRARLRAVCEEMFSPAR